MLFRHSICFWFPPKQLGESGEEMSNDVALPVMRSAMSRDHSIIMLTSLTFDCENIHEERIKTDGAATDRNICTKQKHKCLQVYKPHECITINEQTFSFRSDTKFMQYLPFKPAKNGIKFLCP